MIQRKHRPGRDSPWIPGVVLTGVYFYVWWLDPALRYHASAPVFFWGSDFLSPFFHWPGGLTAYGAALLGQLDRFPWAGALVGISEAGLVYCGSRRFFSHINSVFGGSAGLIPVCFWLILENRYQAQVHEISTGLALALWLALAFGVLPWHSAALRLAVFWLLAFAVYWVAGAPPALLLVLFGGALEAVGRSGICGACYFWLAGLLVPLASYLGGFNLLGEVAGSGTGWPFVAAVCLYASFPLAALVLSIWSNDPAPNLANDSKPTHSSGVFGYADSRSSRLQFMVYIGLGALAAVLVFVTFDGKQKAFLRFELLAKQRNWRQLLACVPLAAHSPVARLYVTQALFQTDRLGSGLFSVPQIKGQDLLPSTRHGLQVFQPLSETLLELGEVNLAEHWAHESLELEGPHPAVLKELALINVLKDRPNAARIFLNKLKRIPFQCTAAERSLQALEADPRLSTQEDLALIRSRAATTDLPDYHLPTDALLRHLLLSNPRNRMAFEYLMTHYLLNLQLDQIVQELWRLDLLGYAEIPRHYEEALLLYQKLHAGTPLDLKGRQIRPETVQRFQRLDSLMASNQGRTAGIEPILASEFGDSFWFFYMFGETPRRATTQVHKISP